MIRSVVGACLFCATSVVAFEQSPTSTPAFEVASIKPADPQPAGMMRIGMGGDPGRVNYTNVSLKDVLQRAYKVKRPQITGPSWLDTDRYNIIAKVPEGVSSDQVPVMLQNLLIERFKLTLHRDSKEMPVYALVVGKNGPKLEKAEDDGPGLTAPGEGPNIKSGEASATVGPPPPPGPGGARAMIKGGGIMIMNGHVEAKKTTVSAFADMLSNMMDRPVIDQTEIQGNYNFTLDIAMEDLAMMKGAIRVGGPPGGGPSPDGHGGVKTDGGPAPDSAPSASIFSAIQKLGLKLEPRKAPLDFIIIEKGNRVPTEN